MPEKIVLLNEETIRGQLKELARSNVEETPTELVEAEAGQPGTSVTRSAKATVADITAVILPPLPGTLP